MEEEEDVSSEDETAQDDGSKKKRTISALVSPSPTKKRRRLTEGWCERRCVYGSCFCYKAELCQRCQSCHRYVMEGHCIFNPGGGWVHVRCSGDEDRGVTSIVKGLNTNIRMLESGDEAQGVQEAIMCEEDHETDKMKNSQSAVLVSQSQGDKGEDESGGIHGARQSSMFEDNHDSDYEDDSDTAVAVPQKPQEEPWTREQLDILNHEASPGDLICINALAGCGKTTTIALLCNRYEQAFPSGIQMLYVVFGSEAQTEARASNKFPKGGMTILTSHACVRRLYFGISNFMNCKPVNAIKLDDIISKLGLVEFAKEKFPNLSRRKVDKIAQTVAGYIRKTIAKFQVSCSGKVKPEHVYWLATKQGLTHRTKWRESLCAQNYTSWAQEIFDDLYDKCRNIRDHGGEAELPHDIYMKVAQLEGLRLPYDVIAVDEAQDLTPCQADIFWGDRNRQDKIIYLFGDQWQQLYRFRGASDSFKDMRKTPNTKNMSLTGSFRFGKKIADAASLILKFGGGEQVTGLSSVPGHVLKYSSFTKGVAICRSNNGMMSYLLHNGSRIDKWTFLKGKGHTLVPSNTICSLERFLWKEEVSFKFKGETFTDIDDLHEYCEETDDAELRKDIGLLTILMKHTPPKRVRDFYADIQLSYVPLDEGTSIEQFDGVILTTCHGIKGLEFDNVYIHSDFKFDTLMKTSDYLNKPRLVDEVNIFYVAVTRTKKKLYLSKEADKFTKYLKRSEYISTDRGTARKRQEWEAAWERFDADENPITHINDIPWPVGSTPNNPFYLDDKMGEEEQLAFVRRMILRFHADKFMPKYGHRFKEESREKLESIVTKSGNGWFLRAKEIYELVRSFSDEYGIVG